MSMEPQQGSKVCRHCTVGKEARNNLLEPLRLFGDRPVHPSTQFVLYFLELRSYAVTPGLVDNPPSSRRTRHPASDTQ